MKYQWISAKKKKISKTSVGGHKITYTVFILPAGKGIVFQCEKQSGSGAWMHVTGDGEEICMGKLSRKPIRTAKNEDSKCSEETFLYQEAFSRRPKKYRNIQDAHPPYLNCHENQSMCTSVPLHYTVYSTPSTNSVPLLHQGNGSYKQYKKISSLLHGKN